MPGTTARGPPTHREAPSALPPIPYGDDGQCAWPGRVTIAPMAEPASTLAAGSVGTVETQYIDLPGPVRLDCGQDLYPVRVAYETYGTLSPRRDNVVLVCHALSGDAHAAGF